MLLPLCLLKPKIPVAYSMEGSLGRNSQPAKSKDALAHFNTGSESRDLLRWGQQTAIDTATTMAEVLRQEARPPVNALLRAYHRLKDSLTNSD